MNALRLFAAALAVVAVSSCSKKDAAPGTAAPPAVVDAGQPPRPVTLTFLVTGAENGYLLATPDEGVSRGGAAETMGAWVTREKHCPGPLAADGAASCADAATVALSTGDNGNGQAISSYFKGQPTAEVMKAMGYAGSSLGNRELDWPREQFLANTAAGGFPYLAANLLAKDDDGKKLGLLPMRVLTRLGLKVGVIGLAAKKATLTPMPGRMVGVASEPEAQAMADAVRAAKAAGAAYVVVVSDGCLDEVPGWLDGHPEWTVAFVAARKCDAPAPDAVGATKLVYPGRHFNGYARVAVTFDAANAVLKTVDAKNVEVVSGEGQPAADAAVKAVVDGWKTKLDAALGDGIGFTKAGLEQESKEMATWLTASLKERFSTDVALLNRKGVRQGLPAGRISKASIYDLVPWDNQIVVVKVTGEVLLAALGNVEARVAGLKPKGDGWVDAKGAAVDPKKTYTVATTDYLYLGGDGFQLAAADPNPQQTGVSWQAALIGWTESKKTSDKKPLESLLQ